MEASFSATDPSTGSTSRQSIIEVSVAIMTGQLQQHRQRLPKGSEKALAEISTLEETTTERIFLDHGGKAAWLGLYCATRFCQKASERTALASLRQASAADQIEVARRVHDSAEDPSIASAIDKLSQRRLHRSTKQNPTQSIPTASSATSPGCATPPPAPNETQIISTAIPKLPSNDVKEIKVQDHASQQGMVDVFNKNLCDVIGGETVERDGTTFLGKRAVTMAFAVWGMEDCVMTLTIHPRKVKYLANSLFNVQIESARHIRSLVFPGGARAVPSPEIILKGVRADVIMRIFGPEIYAAVMASHMRAKELADGVEVPQGVSMILPVSSRGAVVVKLALEAFRAVQIGRKLFP